MRKHRFIGAAVSTLVLATSVGVGLTPGQSGASASFLPPARKGPAPASIKVGLSGGYALNFLPAEIAMGGGYYKQVAARFHTNITFDVYSAGSLAEAAFLAGTDQFVQIGPTNQVSADNSGKDELNIFGGGIALGIAMVAAQKNKATLGSNIPAFGPPATWCQISSGGTSSAAAHLLAAENHLNISQLNLQTTGSVASVLPDVQDGECTIIAGDVNSAANGIISGVAYVPDNLEAPGPTIALTGQDAGELYSTSYAFSRQYPQFTQAMVDAELEALKFIQAHLNNTEAIYKELPAAMKSGLPIGSFAEAMTLIGPQFAAKGDSAEYNEQTVNDTVYLNEALGNLPIGVVFNPAHFTTNKYVIQAYKDDHFPTPSKLLQGPATMPSSTSEPTSEAATAYSLLTGLAAPANDGTSPLASVLGT